jgi:hypothetical protein
MKWTCLNLFEHSNRTAPGHERARARLQCLNAVNGKQPVRASRPTPPLGKHPGANFAKTYVDSSF